MFIEFVLGVLASAVANKIPKLRLPAAMRGLTMPLVTLKSGLVVGNFSSPHSFTFTDGSMLPACQPERSALGALSAEETDVTKGRKARWTDIKIDFSLSDTTRAALHDASKVECDVIIVPRVVLEALRKAGRDLAVTKFRTIRLADRVSKIAFADKFCV